MPNSGQRSTIASTATASPLMAKHWAALSDHRSSLMDEQTLRFKLVDGMRGLYESIAGDVRGDILLDTPVQRITHSPTAVEVKLADGTTQRADAVIVTAPIGALSNIEFDPPLPAGQQKVLAEGTVAEIQADPKVQQVYLGTAAATGTELADETEETPR